MAKKTKKFADGGDTMDGFTMAQRNALRRLTLTDQQKHDPTFYESAGYYPYKYPGEPQLREQLRGGRGGSEALNSGMALNLNTGKQTAMKKGGAVKAKSKASSASKRADGIATKGKTRGRMI